MLKSPVEVFTRSEAETEELGGKISELEGLDVLALCGDLGAGKTALVRGLVRALGSAQVVQSPTFALSRRYGGNRPVWHFDFYRLDKETDLLALDWPPSEKGALAVVEWADKFPRMFREGTLWLHLGLRDAATRDIRMGGRPVLAS